METLIDSVPALSCKTEPVDHKATPLFENDTHSTNNLAEIESKKIKTEVSSENTNADSRVESTRLVSSVNVKDEFVSQFNGLDVKTENVSERDSQIDDSGVTVEENTTMENTPNSQYTYASVQARVWGLLEKDGWVSQATESTANRITDMLMNDMLQTEEQLSGLLGIKHPSLAIGNNSDDDDNKGDHKDFGIEMDVDESQDDFLTEQISNNEVKDKCGEGIEEFSILQNYSSIVCQSNEDVAIGNDETSQQGCAATIGGIKMHPNIHTWNGPNGCLDFGKTNEDALTETDGRHEYSPLSEEKPWKCLTREKSFLSFFDLQRHIRACTQEGKPHKCPTCGKAFSQNSSLQRHIKTHSVVKNLVRKDTGEECHNCPICGKIYTSRSGLQHHVKTHTGEKPHECPTCGKAVSAKSNLKVHIRKHTGEKPHKCPTCGKGFSSSSDFKKHLRTHNGEKPHKCPTCGKAFSEKSGLQRHIKIHSVLKKPIRKDTDEECLKCLICGKVYSSKSGLQYHVKTHTGKKTHKCPTCGKAFFKSSSLQRHIKTHSALKKQMIKHTGEECRKCLICGKIYSTRSGLLRHVKIHAGEKPHKCLTCGKAFSQNSSLQRHNNTHSAIKNCVRKHAGKECRKCLICGKIYTSRFGLRRHVKTHTGENSQSHLTFG